MILMHGSGTTWMPAAAVRLEMANRQVTTIVDYYHCPWMLAAAAELAIDHDPQ